MIPFKENEYDLSSYTFIHFIQVIHFRGKRSTTFATRTETKI